MGEPYDAEAEAERYWDAFDDVPGYEVLDLSVWLRRAHDAGIEAGRRERDDALRTLARCMRREARAKDGSGHVVLGGGMLLHFADEIEGLLDRGDT